MAFPCSPSVVTTTATTTITVTAAAEVTDISPTLASAISSAVASSTAKAAREKPGIDIFCGWLVVKWVCRFPTLKEFDEVCRGLSVRVRWARARATVAETMLGCFFPRQELGSLSSTTPDPSPAPSSGSSSPVSIYHTPASSFHHLPAASSYPPRHPNRSESSLPVPTAASAPAPLSTMPPRVFRKSVRDAEDGLPRRQQGSSSSSDPSGAGTARRRAARLLALKDEE
ncbi:hypothetical protein FQN54_008884 [Arachnomyces sp. PD_36]|nr:hypothetical protein FQN54_008884 [Arachnomyces sp. PD_36]